MRQIQAAHLAEQSGNLWRGDEIAGAAKGVAGLIIAGSCGAKAGGHIVVEADGSVAVDALCQCLCKSLLRGRVHAGRRQIR